MWNILAIAKPENFVLSFTRAVEIKKKLVKKNINRSVQTSFGWGIKTENCIQFTTRNDFLSDKFQKFRL
jgi:hypothetical protein